MAQKFGSSECVISGLAVQAESDEVGARSARVMPSGIVMHIILAVIDHGATRYARVVIDFVP